MSTKYESKIAQRGQIVVISGPSNVGRRTIINEYLSHHPNACKSISATTREPKPGEEDGKDYFFMSRTEFDRMIKNGLMLEYSYINSECYGTPKKAVEDARNAGHTIILETDVMGAMKIRSLCPDATLIYIMPPSWEELVARAHNDNTDSEEVIQMKLEQAKEDISCAGQCDYIIINDEVKKAARRLDQIIHGNRFSRVNMKDFLASYIEGEIQPLIDLERN